MIGSGTSAACGGIHYVPPELAKRWNAETRLRLTPVTKPDPLQRDLSADLQKPIRRQIEPIR
jgi:hypothetical protein